MPKIAFVFPGQGSQYVGMARDFNDNVPSAKETIASADRILGVPLSTICFDGPEDALRQTSNTQPAIFLHSIVAARMITSLKPDMVAGHSLGEYSALVAAEAISFEDGLRLVRLRGELMQRAGQEQKGTMAAVVGLAPDVVESVCQEASASGVVQPANFNSPGQIVISGSVDGVRKAMELSRGKGAKMVKELVVSGAFHSPLMESAREGLREALDRTTIKDARIPVYANVTAEPVTRSSAIRELLFSQLTSPVRWEQTVRNMVRDGAVKFVEVGPGKVLQGLAKRTESGVQTAGVDKFSDIALLETGS
jgi:[acyl-carrier-protein] S-malonyltransferase